MSFIIYPVKVKNLKRNLEAYKKLHAKLAEEKGVFALFMAAKTMTEAKKILFKKKR